MYQVLTLRKNVVLVTWHMISAAIMFMMVTTNDIQSIKPILV